MASSSSAATSSSSPSKWTYDVFLSFRGEIRNTFTSHLYERLDRKGIVTFLDDKGLEKGSTISVRLLKAIEESIVAIVIFSEDYASSHWCLDELVHIKKCKNDYNQEVIPVFVGVDPREVRHQNNESFRKAFAEHESKYTNHQVQEWRTALTEMGKLNGYDIRGRNEAECITEIVNEISKNLLMKRPLSSVQNVVGFDSRLVEFMALLDMKTDDVQIVGIWGMGGIGKTTIATALFDTLLHGNPSYQFDTSFILEDVKEEVKRTGMLSVQNTLLSGLLGEKVENKHDGKYMLSTRLRSKKVLILLDDINDREQMENLAGDRRWFGKGSKIFVTTRDKQFIGNADVAYEVTTLPNCEAIQLFNQHAFKHEVPDRRFEKLSQEVVNYANGLPLALVVWGSSLNGKQDIEHWKSVVRRMKDCSSKIEEKLKISFDGLEDQDKEIFLDISCFFRWRPKDYVVQILESCGFQAIAGLNALIEKCLVFVSDSGRIEMHDLIQDMGKHVVELEKELLGECSRIWRCNDFKRVMTNNTGNHVVKAIRVTDLPNFKISKDAMRNMKNLRMLHTEQFPSSRLLTYDGECLPNSLRWLAWSNYSSESLPPNFEPENLVHLELHESKLHRLWTEQKELPQLRKLLLKYSDQLEQTPDFKMIPNLEILHLTSCKSLKEVHHSLGYCRNLTELDLSFCCGLEEVPHSLGYCINLTKLGLRYCRSLKALPSSISKLKKLVKLDVSGCKKLESLPQEIGDLENLEELDASEILISQLPSSIVRLIKLKRLIFTRDSKSMLCNKALPFVFSQVSGGLHSLEELDLSHCGLIDGLPEDIIILSSLKVLRLYGNWFDHLPRSLAHLYALQVLDLGRNPRLKELPELPPNIVELRADIHLAEGSIQNLATKYVKLHLITFTSFGTLNNWEEDFADYELAKTLSLCISSLQDALSASDFLLQRTITLTLPGMEIPRWFDLEGVGVGVVKNPRWYLFNLPNDWYVRGTFLGFALCFIGYMDWIVCIRKLILLCNDDELEQQSVKLRVHTEIEFNDRSGACFLFVPFNCLWDESKANGNGNLKTPNDYRHLKLKVDLYDKFEKARVHLLYKKPVGTGRSSGYDDGESSS